MTLTSGTHMYSCTHCIPSLKIIDLLALEKNIFKGFLLYMDMAVI